VTRQEYERQRSRLRQKRNRAWVLATGGGWLCRGVGLTKMKDAERELLLLLLRFRSEEP
jgi:hypothetical protein